MCDYCDQWRNHDKACVQRITNELQEKLVYNCSALWDGWLAVAERQQAFKVEGFDASCSSLWYQKLAEYLASWKPPVDLAPDALEAINTLKGHWLDKFFCPEGWFATVEGIDAHIKLKKQPGECLLERLGEPRRRHLVHHARWTGAECDI